VLGDVLLEMKLQFSVEISRRGRGETAREATG
jgi:hypothetical protein